MESLYAIAVDPNIDLNKRYEAARDMQRINRVNKIASARLKKKRDYQAEYKRRQELLEGIT